MVAVARLVTLMEAEMIGHNGGPAVEGGASWRRHCWTAARQALLPRHMALERDWCAAGQLAGYLPARRYFGE